MDGPIPMTIEYVLSDLGMASENFFGTFDGDMVNYSFYDFLVTF